MGVVATAELVGSIIRRVREDKGMSRAQLAAASGMGARTLYALETGESENVGLGKILKVLDALGLSMSIDFDNFFPKQTNDAGTAELQETTSSWEPLPDIWKLDNKERQ